MTLASLYQVTLCPTVPHLYLVTLILSMASPDLLTVVPIGTSPGPHVSVPPGPHQELLSLVTTWVASGYGYTVHYQ